MRYQCSNQFVPQEQRLEINRKLLSIIESGKAEEYGISKEDIYNCYTGSGGLHDLKYGDFENYHKYSEAKKDIENGQFFSSHNLCEFIVSVLQPDDKDIMADLTCGSGNFMNHWPVEHNIYGCENDMAAYKVAKHLYPQAQISHGDIRYYNPDILFDFVIGNPPYNLKWDDESSQFYYCMKAAKLLKPLGILAVVVPNSFLADDFHDSAQIKGMESEFNFISQFSLPEDLFKYTGVMKFPVKLQFWQKKSKHADNRHYLLESEKISLDIRSKGLVEKSLEPYLTLRRKYASRVKLEIAKKQGADQNFIFKMEKLLYQVRIHPNLADRYVECREKLTKFYSQKQPMGMKADEWNKIKLTKKKVIDCVTAVLKSQNDPPERDEIRLIKTDYTLKYKGYSKAMKRLIQAIPYEYPETPIYRAVIDDSPLEDYPGFEKLLRRKRRDYRLHDQSFKHMRQNDDVLEDLDDISFYDHVNEQLVFPNDIQRQDLSLLLQKNYGALQWEQGSGKTIAGMISKQFYADKYHQRNTIIVGNALAVKNTWVPMLEDFGMEFRLIEKRKDIRSIRRGETVLVTLNMLVKYRKDIKKHVRKQSQKVFMILDEADDITNPYGKWTKAVLDCFRRCRYKLLLTGTMTRNNIAESFPQIELTYNNSYNMISWCEEIYHRNKEGELESKWNKFYGTPYPAYRKGYELFTASHNPHKVTVFGVAQQNQDIYNAQALRNLKDKMIITRTLRDITGRDIYELIQRPVPFSDSEIQLYKDAADEFMTMRHKYFNRQDNPRKDAMFRALQQLLLLLKVCAAPNLVDEYQSNEIPTKMGEVISMLEDYYNERVAIGVRNIDVLKAYAKVIREMMPERKLVLVTGESTTLKQRKAIVNKLKATPNTILLCTQQSLACSVSIDCINKIIIPQLHYNNARISQFYFRFIRFTSTEWKQVFYITYANSIESNLLKMIIVKEKLNQFMKDFECNYDELYEQFGIFFDLDAMLNEKYHDKDGNVRVRWGEQDIVA